MPNSFTANSFNTKSKLKVNVQELTYYDLNTLSKSHNIDHLPFSLKILLENLLRFEDGISVRKQDIEALIHWSPKTPSSTEIAFTPSRVILQDFTGVPAVVDLAAMREAVHKLGGDPKKINPLSPVELVIDHSVMVDHYGNSNAFQKNTTLEFGRNEERYAFLRWGQMAFENFKVVPPGTGIVHQVNLEYLARVIFKQEKKDSEKSGTTETLVYPDTLVGTDSHTTMVNGLGVLGWGVGGIEAEAAMLGQPVTMLIPEVIGFKLTGKLPEGTTATDLVLTVVEQLRRKNVVGKFVEFFGEGLQNLSIADRATIANMAPEYGATCGIFPIDAETLAFLELSGRDKSVIELVETYTKKQGLFHSIESPEAEYNDVLILDLSKVEPCIAGPRRPQDRIPLKKSKESFNTLLTEQNLKSHPQSVTLASKKSFSLDHGSVVIAAITSCTNTSNPDVMIGAGLLAKKALELGLTTKPWVKTSLAPGSQVVSDYLEKAGLTKPLEELGFYLVGYGCTTCIGNSGPLLEPISDAIKEGNLAVSAVLSGNRNFEGRIHPDVRYSYLASPPLVVAYALAGTVNIDFEKEPIGISAEGPSVGKPIFLRDIWPNSKEIQEALQQAHKANLYTSRYADVFKGDERWQSLQVPTGERFEWTEKSTYVKHPPYFETISKQKEKIENIENARVLALLGDSVTTDHISPAGDIAKNSPAGRYLQELGVPPTDFNSYGSRRGNHEVMMRGTFANIRLKNQLTPDAEGGMTLFLPKTEKMSIYDAAMRYQQEKCPLIILAGKEYGTGSSRDWAAKGTRLLGVRAVIAESFERIHRSNLIGMGVLPLEFTSNQNAKTLGLTGHEYFSIDLKNLSCLGLLKVIAKKDKSSTESIEFQVVTRIDTPKELEYYQQGGILHYVLRELVKQSQ